MPYGQKSYKSWFTCKLLCTKYRRIGQKKQHNTTAPVKERLPDAVQIFDHFHIVKLMNDKLDKVRCDSYNQETDENKRRLIKGQRWLLLANGDNLSPKAEERLYKALDINMATTYYLKESFRRVWWQYNKKEATIALDDWIQQSRQSGLKPIESIADTLSRHCDGILAWYDYHISNSCVFFF